VFALRAIASGECVEVSPVLLFRPHEWDAHARHTLLAHYTFVWRDAPGAPSYALALGNGSIFNHAKTPNTGWRCSFEGATISFVALRDIAPHEELFICYAKQSELWFEDALSQQTSSDEETEDVSAFLSSLPASLHDEEEAQGKR
jgi:SET domain-containing protein